MRKNIFIFLFLMCLCISLRAQQGVSVTSMSPKLRKFLSENPKAFQLLTNTFFKVFTNRTVQLSYFYSEDESVARACHKYPAEAVVSILIRENQQPMDEYIGLLFEAINSTGEKRFKEILEKAQAGTISKKDFAKEIIKIEFSAVKHTRDLLKGLKLNESESAKSYFYKRFSGCPDNYEDFEAYSKKVSPERDAIENYEAQYDWLRNTKEVTQ
jgi:hypothetical protein